MSASGRASSERRLTALGTGNWNNRGIDNHIKRPAGVSSCGLKRMGMKRIDGIPHPLGCGNTSEGIEQSLKYPKQCLVNNEHIYDAGVVRHSAAANIDPHDCNQPPAGIEASKTVQYNNYEALSNKERDGPEGGKPPSWLLGQQKKRRVYPNGRPDQKSHGNPIKHDYVMPHKLPVRPIRRMGPTGNDGPVYDNGAAALNWNLQNQQLNTGPLLHHELTAEEFQTVGQRLHISPLGELRYNVGGKEDLRPACTRAYTKADKPASRLTQYENDKRQLPLFERRVETNMCEPRPPNQMLLPSPDMIAAMAGEGYGGSTATAAESCLYLDARPELSPQSRTYAPSEYSCDPASGLKPAPVYPPESAPGVPLDTRASPSVQSFASEPRRRASSQGGYGQGGRTPASARGSERSYRSYHSSIASSYYYESEGGRSQTGRSQGSRRAKSADRLSYGRSSQRSERSGYSDQRSFYSDTSRTVAEQALNEALRNSRSLGRSQTADCRRRRPNTAR